MSVNWCSRFYSIFTAFLLFFFITTFCYSFEVGQYVKISFHTSIGKIIAIHTDESSKKITIEVELKDNGKREILRFGKGASLFSVKYLSIVDRSHQRFPPTVLLVGNIAEGIGDLVHLEEYTKFLKSTFEGRIKIEAITTPNMMRHTIVLSFLQMLDLK